MCARGAATVVRSTVTMQAGGVGSARTAQAASWVRSRTGLADQLAVVRRLWWPSPLTKWPGVRVARGAAEERATDEGDLLNESLPGEILPALSLTAW